MSTVASVLTDAAMGCAALVLLGVLLTIVLVAQYVSDEMRRPRLRCSCAVCRGPRRFAPDPR